MSLHQAESSTTHPLILLAIKLVSGTISTTLIKLPTTPIINARYILQAQSADPRLRRGSQHLKSTTQIIKQVYNDQGLISLWRGLPVEMLRNGLQTMMNPFLFVLQKGLLPKYNPNTDFVKFYLRSIGGGFITGSVFLLITRPLEYARVKLALDSVGKGEYSGALDVIMKTIKGPNGFASLYTGLSLACAKILIYRVAYFGVFDLLKLVNPFYNETGLVGLLSKFVSSQLVAMSSLALCYPFEVTERKLQLQADKEKKDWVYKGTVDCLKKTWEEEGISGFYSGFANNVTTAIVTTVVLVTVDILFRSD